LTVIVSKPNQNSLMSRRIYDVEKAKNVLTSQQRSASTHDCGQLKNGQYPLVEFKDDQSLARAIPATRR